MGSGPARIESLASEPLEGRSESLEVCCTCLVSVLFSMRSYSKVAIEVEMKAKSVCVFRRVL